MRQFPDGLTSKRFFSAITILSENITRHFWRVGAWVIFFCGLWMLNIPMVFGEITALITLFVFIGGLGFILKNDLKGFRFPNLHDIDMRLEKASALKHRPLSNRSDKLANPDKKITQDLWRDNKAKMAELISGLKAPKRRAILAARDPYGLRLLAVLVFMIGLMVSGSNWDLRIKQGLSPISFSALTNAPASPLHLWITPPEYTGFQQIVLDDTKALPNPLQIPTGSQIKIRMRAALKAPSLVIDGISTPMKKLNEKDYGLEMELPKGEKLKISTLFGTFAQWDYELLPDTPPSITKSGDIEILDNGQFIFPLYVIDDYGVQDLLINVRLANSVEKRPLFGKDIQETRAIFSPAGEGLEISPLYDFTSHPWAGLPVEINFTAIDALNQNTHLAPITLHLPKRKFRHPVAKEITALRRRLIWSPLESRLLIAQDLEKLLGIPFRYNDDKVVFLAIRSAASRLLYSLGKSDEVTKKEIRTILPLLWDVALRIEDGDIDRAMHNLNQAQKNLSNALKDENSSDQEIAHLMQELREAMAEYFTEVQKELQKQLSSDNSIMMVPPEMMKAMMNPEILAQFLEKMEAALEDGERLSAQKMLSDLQRMMEKMNPAMARPMPQDMQDMAKSIKGLQELIDAQQDLLERTEEQVMHVEDRQTAQGSSYGEALAANRALLKKWGIDVMPPAPAPTQEKVQKLEFSANTQDKYKNQEELRHKLGEIMLEAQSALGKIPDGMGKAERAMNSSSQALLNNYPARSIPFQEKALKHLQSSAQKISQQLTKRFSEMNVGSFNGGGIPRDPMGRPLDQDGGLGASSNVQIPDNAQKKQMQEILKLLRARAGEFHRPAAERDYYRRLLRQF